VGEYQYLRPLIQAPTCADMDDRAAIWVGVGMSWSATWLAWCALPSLPSLPSPSLPPKALWSPSSPIPCEEPPPRARCMEVSEALRS